MISMFLTYRHFFTHFFTHFFRSSFFYLLLFFLLLPLFSDPLSADTLFLKDGQESDAQKNRHDGFLFRYQVGSGSGRLDSEVRSISGGTGSFSTLQFGYAFNSAFALHGGASYALVRGDYKVNNISRTVNASYDMLLPTVGASFYIMPPNVFFAPEFYLLGSGSTISDPFSITDDAGNVSTPLELDADLGSGMGFGLRMGREWWVSDNWGLGVALYFSVVSFDIADCESDCEIDTFLYGLAFSATYN